MVLCGPFVVLQAPGSKCFALDPFSLVYNGLGTTEVDIGRRDVIQALMITLVIVVIDECSDLGFEITWQEVDLQQDTVMSDKGEQVSEWPVTFRVMPRQVDATGPDRWCG